MTEGNISPLSVTHLLQHTLRSLCFHENSQWVYAVFWRILPRNYPPPKWEDDHGLHAISRGNRRNWILAWEDGFCNFVAATTEICSHCHCLSTQTPNCEFQHFHGLQPELFFKMSHEIYNYGEGTIGKVAAEHSHKWIHSELNDQEIPHVSSWYNNSTDSHPRTWEAQFHCGIKTIAVIAVSEGVIQLGSLQKVIEDLSYVVFIRKRFSFIESIPGVLLPHPSSSSPLFSVKSEERRRDQETWRFHAQNWSYSTCDSYNICHEGINVAPSMNSLESLLSKLPSVVPPLQPPLCYGGEEMKMVNRDCPTEHEEGEGSRTLAAYQNPCFKGYQNLTMGMADQEQDF